MMSLETVKLIKIRGMALQVQIRIPAQIKTQTQVHHHPKTPRKTQCHNQIQKKKKMA